MSSKYVYTVVCGPKTLFEFNVLFFYLILCNKRTVLTSSAKRRIARQAGCACVV